ncbi:MAG: Dyp-type peroxidase [Thiotrichaceae bacterium]
MNTIQNGILQPIPRAARYLMFSLKPNTQAAEAIHTLAKEVDGESLVVGLGLSLIQHLNSHIEGLRTFPALSVESIEVPSTPVALCCWIRGNDQGELVHRTRELKQLLQAAFKLDQVIDAFQYGESLDLTGYEDGTENPEDDAAVEAGIVSGKGMGLDGSSFLAIQQWEHDLDYFESLPQPTQNHTFGRRKSDNEELDDAPKSAHVKRTAQEDFEPEAFVLRRSMPWADAEKEGLVFVAFGHSFDAFEALLNRMVGVDDGIVDALFTFTRPVTGSYLWCPPMKAGELDLSAINQKSSNDKD